MLPRTQFRLMTGFVILIGMKQVLALTLLLLAQACGRAPVIDPAFQSVVKDFEQLSSKTVWVDVEFDDTLAVNVGGRCNPSAGKITISRAAWNTFDAMYKEWVLFHELGHCALSREHSDALNEMGQPVSIMHSWKQPSRSDYAERRTAFVRELVEGL